jgi:GT2 family glycosyltransferase
MNQIGVGIITCDRVNMFNACFDSLKDEWFDKLVVVDDGVEENPLKREGAKFIRTVGRVGVGKAKNIAIQNLLDNGCDYIFIVEDDMIFKGNLFAEYIKAHETTGIHHLMFGYHGPANKAGVSGGKPVPRKVIDYEDNVKIALNQHCVGSFCFYTRKSLEAVGLLDEEFNKNNFEHVEHSYRLAKAGYSTPYWWWSDLANSLDYIEEQACSEVSSSIRRGDEWHDKIRWSAKLFEKKHGYMPAWNNAVPDTDIKDILNFLKNIYKKYGK